MTFDITRDGQTVGRMVGGRLITNDSKLQSMVNLGVATSTGGSAFGVKWEGKKLVLPGQLGYLEAFVTQLLDEGYSVPLWVTQSIA